MSTTTAVWLYAVAPAVRHPELVGVRGVAGEPVRTVGEGRLAAVVGTVPLEDFAEAPLRDHLEDLEWLEDAARAHHGVIDTAGRSGVVIPLRFATIYHDDDAVAAVLEERAPDFTAALERISGRAEWGVKAYVDPQALEPEPAASTASGKSPGTAYLLQRRAQREGQDNARHAAMERATRIRDELSELAVGMMPHPPQDARLAGFQGWMILNDSYLVDEDRTEEFTSAFTSCEQRFPDVRMELSGPWPAYSFTAEDQTPQEE